MAMSGDAQKLFEDPKNFIFSDRSKTYNSVVKADIYFASENMDFLVKETVNINQTMKDLPTALFLKMLDGPMNGDYNTIIPDGTELLWAKTDKDICTLNLNKRFLENMPKDPSKEKLVIYAIVNSITSLEGIDKVQFLVENSVYETFYSINVSKPIEPDFSIVSE